MLRDARRAATLIAAHWRGHVGRRMARQQRRDRAATRIASHWRGHRQRKAFLAYRVTPVYSFCILQLLDCMTTPDPTKILLHADLISQYLS